MTGAIATMVLAYAATAGADHVSGSRWVLPSHQSAFVAAPASGASSVSRRAGLQQQSATSQPSHKNGFFAQKNTNSRQSLTKTFASADDVELKVDYDQDKFSCQNAYYFAQMSQNAYSTREEVKTVFQGNETVTGLGFDHFHWFEAPKELSEKSLFDEIQDTEAYVAANDDMVMAVFRGTKELTDWTTNLDFLPRRVEESWGLSGEGCDVHRGFDDGLNTVWNGEQGMLETIKTLLGEAGKNRKLYVSGHSLGAALATIAGARLAFEHDIEIAGIYTIGSPRVFDGQLSEIFDKKINHGTSLKDKYFRCRNNNDIVPRIVPPPYEHVGTEIYLTSTGEIKHATAWDRFRGRYSAYLKLDFVDNISDHSAAEYIRIFKTLAANK